MPCNNTGFTDPETTKGWSIIDFDWSNSKGTGSADGWAKHKPMDDEEMLFKQVQMTTAATKGTTVWVYRNTVYGYETTIWPDCPTAIWLTWLTHSPLSVSGTRGTLTCARPSRIQPTRTGTSSSKCVQAVASLCAGCMVLTVALV